MGIVKKSSEKQPEVPKSAQSAIGIDPTDSGERAIGVEPAIGTDPTSPNIIKNPDNSMGTTVDITPWLDDAKWPQPTWLKEQTSSDNKLLDKNFDKYLQNTLRWRYQRLEGDFRTVLNNFYKTVYVDDVVAMKIVGFLQTAREVLERDKCDPMVVGHLLDMTDQYIVWLYPPHVALTQANALCTELKARNHTLGSFLENEIGRSDRTLGSLRAALDRVKDTLNQENQTVAINNALQIERLDMLIRWGTIIAVVMLLGVPLLTKTDTRIFSDTMLSKFLTNLQPWVSMAVIALVGCVGAFLSGLMQIKRTRVTIGEFKESIVQFRLRPVIGSIFAMLVAALLSWNLITGIEITNAGVFILIAFLCGFSERFFLSLLKIDEDGNSTNASGAPIVSAAAGQAAIQQVDAEGKSENVNERKI
jgi:hypothetical protein